jgi:hypothetical protein
VNLHFAEGLIIELQNFFDALCPLKTRRLAERQALEEAGTISPNDFSVCYKILSPPSQLLLT